MSIPRNHNEMKAQQSRAGAATRNTDPLRHPGAMGLTPLSAQEIADLSNWDFAGPAIEKRTQQMPNGVKKIERGLVARMVRKTTMSGDEEVASAWTDMHVTMPTLIKHHPKGQEFAQKLCDYFDMNVQRVNQSATVPQKTYPNDRRAPANGAQMAARTPAAKPAENNMQSASTSLWARLNNPVA